MGTRSVFTFLDAIENNVFSVYKHWDGYPEGAAEFLTNALPYSWGLDRFEASDFAAAFVAGNKTEGGNVRFTTGVDAHGDLEYYYEVSPSSRNGQICIIAYEVRNCEIQSPFFEGRLKDFVREYGDESTKKKWDNFDKSSNKISEGV